MQIKRMQIKRMQIKRMQIKRIAGDAASPREDN